MSKEGDLISIIICARNEAANLKQYLPLILAQDYQPFEVIVVNHGSTDDTLEILDELQMNNEKMRILSVKYGNPGKREALKQGLKTASGSIILLTDADCKPTSNLWIAKMISPFQQKKNLVLGIGPFKSEPGFLNAFARWENLVTMFLFTSQTYGQKPFMAVGRNLAYRRSRSLFDERNTTNLVGGDDDLLVNKLGRRQISWVVTDPDTYMISQAKKSLTAFFSQKRRHVSTSMHYNLSDRIFLLSFASSTWWHLVGTFLLIVVGLWPLGLILYLARFLAQMKRVSRVPDFNGAYQFGGWLPIVDLAFVLYYPLLCLFMMQKAPKKW